MLDISKNMDFTIKYLITWLIVIPIMAICVYLWNATYHNNVNLECSKAKNECTLIQRNIYLHKHKISVNIDNIVQAKHDISYKTISQNSRSISKQRIYVSNPRTVNYRIHSFLFELKNNEILPIYSISDNLYRLNFAPKIDLMNKHQIDFNNYLKSPQIDKFILKHNEPLNFIRDEYIFTIYIITVAIMFIFPFIGAFFCKKNNPIAKFIFTEKGINNYLIRD